MTRHCLALDLIDDPQRIEEYKQHHKSVWPEIQQTFLDAGVVELEMYAFGNRLFMILDVEDRFSLEAKAAKDAADPRVQEWEKLMGSYQQAVPGAKPGEKWVTMELFYSLKSK